MTSVDIDIRCARSSEEIATAREMFREYQEWLGVDLCFQDFEHELASLPGKYTPPMGEIFIAYVGEQVAGIVAIRQVGDPDAGRSEMKRLYVREDFRGYKLGRRLAEVVVKFAKKAGYRSMVLDTLPHLAAAIHLYGTMGFVEIPPYYDNPLPGVVYFEKML